MCLDPGKIEKFGLIDYHETRFIMGLSREDYNITISNASGGIMHSYGRAVASRTVVSERIAVLDGGRVGVSVRLFYGEGGL